MDLQVGDRIDHERYGEGIVSEIGMTGFSVIFVRGGEVQLSESNTEYEVIKPVNRDGSEGGPSSGTSLSEIEEVVKYVLEKYNSLNEEVALGDKWTGGTLVLNPADESMQSKEIPMETFFHKIVMLRDRLRVLEQNVNSHSKLDAEDKVHLQQYITKAYGSLTTFNLLFRDKADYFKGSSKN
jgi:hypothetical protein